MHLYAGKTLMVNHLPIGNKFREAFQTMYFFGVSFCELKCLYLYKDLHIFPNYSPGILSATDMHERI